MKNVMKFIRIIALLTAFIAAGCKNGTPENNEPGDTDDNFIPVTNITGVKTTVPVGTVSLGGKVVPSDATYKIIRWMVLSGGDIDGTISGNILTTSEEGFIKVRATVENGKAEGENFTKDFTITVEPFVAVTNISDVTDSEEIGVIYLDGTVHPDDATYTDIIWSIKKPGTTMAAINGNVLTTEAKGTVTVTATIENGLAEGKDYTQDFPILIIEM